jgi:hypothetical protein
MTLSGVNCKSERLLASIAGLSPLPACHGMPSIFLSLLCTADGRRFGADRRQGVKLLRDNRPDNGLS